MAVPASATLVPDGVAPYASYRLLALKTQTNGMDDEDFPPLPYSNFPTSVAVYVATVSGSELLYASDIRGATQMNAWVRRQSSTTPASLEAAPSFAQVMRELGELLHPSDVLVFHNARYCRTDVLANAARREGVDASRLLGLRCYCTCKDPGARQLFGACPSLSRLCRHFNVRLDDATAQGSAKALAECLSAAVHSKSPLAADIEVALRGCAEPVPWIAPAPETQEASKAKGAKTRRKKTDIYSPEESR
jgi:hypothetical protein